MQKTIIGTTFDLMSYDKSGNFGKFDRIFSKVAEYFQIQNEPSLYRKFRNLTFHYLKSTGYLEVDNTSKTKWTTCSPTLVEKKHGEFIFLGPSHEFKKYLEHETVRATLELQKDYYISGLPPTTFFLPPVLKVNTSLKTAKDLTGSFGHMLSLDHQQALFSLLPTMSNVRNIILKPLDDVPLFEDNLVEKYNFEDLAWEPFRETRPDSVGLYKRTFEFASPEYLLCKSVGKMLVTYRVDDPEWALLVTLDALDKNFTIQYEVSSKNIILSKDFPTLRLPTLIERAFRTGNFTGPIASNGKVVYSNISQQSVLKLVGKLPVFRVKNI